MSVPPFFMMPKNVLFSLGLPAAENTFYQLSPDDLTRQCEEKKEDRSSRPDSFISDNDKDISDNDKEGGRNPKSTFIVIDNLPFTSVEWDVTNEPIEEKFFDSLYQKMIDHLSGKKIWIRDSCLSPDAPNKIFIRSISEDPVGDLFIYRMFLHPEQEELTNFNPDWYIILAPSFSADPETDGILQTDFIMVNYAKNVILIGGLQYANEMKETIFSILNFALLHGKKL